MISPTMLRFLRSTLFLICIVFTSVLFGQEKNLKKAKEQFDRYEYIDAQKTYLRVLEQGYRSADLFKYLGDSYYYNSQFDEAQKSYEELMNSYPNEVEPEYYFRYAQTLKSSEKYDEADIYMKKFTASTTDDQRAAIFEEEPNYLKRIDFQSGRYEIYNLAINSPFTDYGGTFYGDDYVVFSSTRDTLITRKEIHQWNNEAFLELFKANYDKTTGELLEYEKMSGTLNSKFHESSPVFTKDGNTVYFTRNNFEDRKIGKDNQGTNKLKLYRSYKNAQGDWTTPQDLSFNSNEYSVAHPALNATEDTLYFSSDMPGGKGESDLYKIAINSDGSFGTPENLGDRINTEAKETFPFIANSGDLYFSSNGHSGLGGLDIFVTKLAPITQQDSLVVNIGKPVNGPDDDFAFAFDEATKRGYFSSNRSGGKGGDDIYSFLQTEDLRNFCEITIKGVVKDTQDEIVPNAKVTIFDKDHNVIEVLRADENGAYQSSEKIECSSRYYVRIEKLDYGTAEMQLDTPDTTQTIDLSDYDDLRLTKNNQPIQPGDDLAEKLALNIIYFGFDQYEIREESKAELDKVVEVMNQYPQMNIEVRSHTDSFGDREYNKMLSEKRAKATVDYIINQGIKADRISGQGFGEDQLLNNCSDGVRCSKEKHQENRRSEFIIIK